MTLLVTGAAGFIGFHLAAQLLRRGERVIGIDNLNHQYDILLKQSRLATLLHQHDFTFHQVDVADPSAMMAIVERYDRLQGIVHLAPAGVMGQVVLLEAALKLRGLKSIVYASGPPPCGAVLDRSVVAAGCGGRIRSPLPAMQHSAELATESHCRLHGLPCTGLRFFTVYGPWGRPDMTYYHLTSAILAGRPIRISNRDCRGRDYTYIDDALSGVVAAIDRPPAGRPSHQLYDIANSRTERLPDFIAVLEQALGCNAVKEIVAVPPAEAPQVRADIEPARRDLGYDPRVQLPVGLPLFVSWYERFHGLR
jgi:UDP-glucuronate 4-epimerase